MEATKMAIIVVPAEKGKYKVLDNYIQVGIEYSTKPLAEAEANKLRRFRGLPVVEAHPNEPNKD